MAKETFSSLIDLFKTTTSTVALVCNVCGTKLNVFRKKKPCAECRRMFCIQCLDRCQDRVLRCRNCFILTMRPPDRAQLMTLRSKDLQFYLNQHNVSTRGCVEKEDLVNVILRHVNKPLNTGSPTYNSQGAASFFEARPLPQNPSSNQNIANPSSNTANPSLSPAHNSDSDSSSTTSFEIVQRPDSGSSHENLGHNSSSSASTSGAAARSDNAVFSEDQGSSGQQVEVNSSALSQNSDSLNAARPLESSELLENPSHQLSAVVSSPNSLRGTMAQISCEADLEELTVKQLKDMLVRHRVNYRGCCEKSELVERAKILYRNYCASRVDLEKLELNELCKICMDAPVECVMLECGHMATCTDCGRQLSECPICRQYVVRIVRTFKA